jgi:hypothetical protein
VARGLEPSGAEAGERGGRDVPGGFAAIDAATSSNVKLASGVDKVGGGLSERANPRYDRAPFRLEPVDQ